jgi:phosphate starvation-inducible PhoH-like protein
VTIDRSRNSCSDAARNRRARRPSLPQRSLIVATLGPGNAAPPLADTPHQVVLAFDDNRLASVLFGQYGQNLALIERRLGVVAEQRGNHVTLEGSRDAVEQARRVLEGSTSSSSAATICCRRRRRRDPAGDRAGLAVRLRSAARAAGFEEINLRKRPVRARTAGAGRLYPRAARTRWCSAPARRHRQDLARGRARRALFERKEVGPHHPVAARGRGRRAARLPAGDMREKVDPYLRPIYDALFDLMDSRIVERAMQTNEIEIAPLAFMRGRTLANAAIISMRRRTPPSMQMKMCSPGWARTAA